MSIEVAVNATSTLVAAFAGAWAAFRFESVRRKKEIIERHIAAANRALFTIYNLWNILFQFQKEVVNPIRGKSDAWLNMSVTLPPKYGFTSFQTEELAFLLQTEHAHTYADLLLEEQRFLTVINQIEMRSSVVLGQAWPRLSDASVQIGAGLTEEQLKKVIGIDVVHKLKVIAEGIIVNTDESVKSLRVAHDQFRDAMKALYPKRKVIRIGFEENRTTHNI